MYKRVGVILVGQCASNIGKCFEDLGYLCHYINTSKEDLSIVEGKSKYWISGAEGCHHDTNVAKGYFKKNYEGILNSMLDVLTKEIVLVIYSAGGGTGSGIGPMLVDALRQSFDKIICSVTVLPDMGESIRVLQNAYRCLNELFNIKDGKGCNFILDNSKEDKFKINQRFAYLFNEFINLKSNVDSRANLDSGEVLEMLSVRGNAILSKNKSDDLGANSVIDAIKNNIFTKIEDDKNIVYIGMNVPYECEDVICDIKSYVGEWYDRFKTYNTKKENLIAMFGLSPPYDKMFEIEDKIEYYKKNVSNSLKNSSDSSLDFRLEEVKIETNLVVRKVDFKAIFDKY